MIVEWLPPMCWYLEFFMLWLGLVIAKYLFLPLRYSQRLNRTSSASQLTLSTWQQETGQDGTISG
eukprot:3440532-Ditylum_brightwellii.AAC.1